ncbi:MAG: hypothetical protein ACI3ZZ_01945 [Candidatus Aphodosoma sp.]
MDEKYKVTIDKIEQLCAQNSEFDKELRKRLNVNSYTEVSSCVSGKVDKIEKYLGLDYLVDSQDSIIDYSFVNDKVVRNQLISDNREMLRFRYSTRYHEINFKEYCRFAHMQAEMLINYFLTR